MTADVTTLERPRSRRRRVAGGVAVVVGLAAVAVVGVFVASPAWSQRGALDPESAGPGGARALAHLLEEHGVDVRVARDRATAEAAVSDATTLVMPDAPFLSDETLQALSDAAGDVVLVEPRSRTLDLLVAGSSPAGTAPAEPIRPECSLDVALRAGEIRTESVYRPSDGVTGCYPADDGLGLLVADDAGRTVTALDGRGVLANDALASEGNAALALGVTGRNPTVVWYVPSPADAEPGDSAPTLGELTPAWVSPVMVLLAATALAAAIWRGRRFGPLIAENLPVTVRANETTAGRARLYARSRDAAHALDQLRIGALARIGTMLGLGAHASPTEIADATADLLRTDRGEVRSILFGLAPRDDRELVELNDRLRALEARVHTAVRPEGNIP